MQRHNIATSTSSLVKSLGWDTLEHRRLFNQSALFSKIHNLANCQPPSPVKSTDQIRSTTSHQLTYCQLQANVSVFNYSFFPRVLESGICSLTELCHLLHEAVLGSVLCLPLDNLMCLHICAGCNR